jgi:monofunctional biosynthetic peptidoglycan transglycosylase
MIKKIFRSIFLFFCILILASIWLVLLWRWVDPPTSAFMLSEWLHTERKLHYQWVSMPEISPHFGIAVVAAEDQKFPEHYGFDFKSIAEALSEKRLRQRGASTISQQVAKNMFLWNGHSYVRKGIEAYLTVLIETLWPKQRILEIYLNVVELGPGIYGAGAASKIIFGKSPRNLNRYESAILAAVLPNPKRMSAARPSPYVLGRAEEIQSEMRRLGGARYLANL